MNEKVLVVDDDLAICKLLEKVLRSNELLPSIVNCGKDALNNLRTNTYDAILIDIVLEDMEGFEIIKDIRSRGINTPILVISGRSEDFDSLYGFSLGADDYITKPFRPLILGAKIKALIRRDKQSLSYNSAIIHCGIFTYNSSTMRFYKENEELILSTKESALMLLFMKHPQQVFTKDIIYEQVWGNSIAVDDNAIMVYINRLRSKIEDNKQLPTHIITLRGIGYRFVP